MPRPHRRSPRLAMLACAGVLACAGGVVAPAAGRADDAGHAVDVWTPAGADDESRRALAGAYTGFGAGATGGEGRPVLTVDSLADGGIGSLRSALEAAAGLGGGRIVFTVAGDLVPRRELVVPANVTLDGLSAPAPGVTIWGDRLAAGGGVLEIGASNVIVRGLRIRNAVNDGIQIAAKRGNDVARVVIDHCSVTTSGDGGIDVTGAAGAVVRDVTLSWNYLAGNGGPCAQKGWCGGAALVKYGVERLSAHGNVWDKNLRRNPSVDGTTLVDLRANVVRGYVESGMQLRGGARGNVVGNVFAGDRPLLTAGATVFAAGNAGATAPSVGAPFDVADALAPVGAAAVLANAGAPPADGIDRAYRDALATYEEVKNAAVGAGSAGGAAGVEAAATPPLDAGTLAAARRTLRAARRARARGDRDGARAAYASVLAGLAAPRGVLARPAHRLAAEAARALATSTADGLARTARLAGAIEHADRAGDPRLARRLARERERLERRAARAR